MLGTGGRGGAATPQVAASDGDADRADGVAVDWSGAWLNREQFDLSYALSRLTPGTNLLAFCTAAGWTTRRWSGAVVALLAASIPCAVLAVIVTVFSEQLTGSVWFTGALAGALAAAVAIIVSTAWVFAEPHVKAAPLKAAIVVPAAVGLALGVGLTPVRILLLAAVVGLVWPAPKSAEPPS